MYTEPYKTTTLTTKPRLPPNPPPHSSTQKQRNSQNIKSHSYSRQNSPQYQQQTQHNEYSSQLKSENTKLKKMLKEAQAKRIQITKECSEIVGKYDRLEEENMQLHRKVKEWKDVGDAEKFRYEEIRFLNKELNAEIQQLHAENKGLNDRLKHQTDILEKKYEELEQRTYKRIEQALKRIKKGIHYLSSLSTKQIEKTKEIQIQNLTKAAEVLRGKYNQSNKFEQQIEQLMNPIRNIQQDLHQKTKQISLLKQENNRLQNEVRKHKKVQKQLLPQYKEAVQKLKKNLGQVRLQLSQNQYDKMQIKRKYQQKLKQAQIKYEQLFKEHRKIKLQNKIFQKKMEEMEDDVEEEKMRLQGENQLLKKLYRSQDVDKSARSFDRELGIEGIIGYHNHEDLDNQPEYDREVMSYKTTANQFRKPVQQYINMGRQNQQRQQSKKKSDRDRKINHIKKNYSASQLHASLQPQQKKQKKPLKLRQSPQPPPTNQTPISQSRQSQSKRKNYDHLRHEKQKKDVEVSDYYHHNELENENENGDHHAEGSHHHGEEEEESGIYREDASSVISVSQDGLKNQIFKIDQEIMEIQKTLDKELNMYK